MAGMHTADFLAAAQRSHRHLAGDGPGVGAYRVEQRGVLDARLPGQDDQAPLQVAAGDQLLDQQPRHDGLARSGVVVAGGRERNYG